MANPLRFTGENPPLSLWRQYPNWRNAIEEEGEPGQDESTLMPDELQTHVGGDTAFTTGVVRLRDGREFPAFLAIGRVGIDGCEVYQDKRPWRIYFNYPEKRWVPFKAEWLPESDRPPAVSFTDDSVFPLEIHMALPWREGHGPSSYRITAEGNAEQI